MRRCSTTAHHRHLARRQVPLSRPAPSPCAAGAFLSSVDPAEEAHRIGDRVEAQLDDPLALPAGPVDREGEIGLARQHIGPRRAQRIERAAIALRQLGRREVPDDKGGRSDGTGSITIAARWALGRARVNALPRRNRTRDQQGVELRAAPLQAPVQMRPRRAAGCPRPADHLALADHGRPARRRSATDAGRRCSAPCHGRASADAPPA